MPMDHCMVGLVENEHECVLVFHCYLPVVLVLSGVEWRWSCYRVAQVLCCLYSAGAVSVSVSKPRFVAVA